MSKIRFELNPKGVVEMLQDPMMIPLIDKYAQAEEGSYKRFKGWDRQKAFVYKSKEKKYDRSNSD